MADDDNELNEEEIAGEDAEIEPGATIADLEDVDEEEVELEGPDEEEFEDEDAEFGGDSDDDVVADEDDDDEEDTEETAARARKRKGEEDEDDDDELLAPDDVEADLDRILKDRMVTTDDEDDDEDEEDDAAKGKVGADAADGLQPKRADEQLCKQCFLLVRSSAPGCPVEDDACPIFS